jgi:hypothetical protein
MRSLKAPKKRVIRRLCKHKKAVRAPLKALQPRQVVLHVKKFFLRAKELVVRLSNFVIRLGKLALKIPSSGKKGGF